MIVISDLHMGDGSRADDFGDADADLIRFVENCQDDIGIAGDLLELWQTDLESILKAHGPALEMLMAKATFYVVGNHDEVMRGQKLFGVEGIQYYADGSLYTVHGHAHDPFIARWPRFAAAVSYAVGWLERRIHPDVDRWAAAVESWITRTGRHGGNERYMPLIAETGAIHDCKSAVFGHTHKLWILGDVFCSRGVYVYNSGAWTNGRRDFVRIIEEAT